MASTDRDDGVPYEGDAVEKSSSDLFNDDDLNRELSLGGGDDSKIATQINAESEKQPPMSM